MSIWFLPRQAKKKPKFAARDGWRCNKRERARSESCSFLTRVIWIAIFGFVECAASCEKLEIYSRSTFPSVVIIIWSCNLYFIEETTKNWPWNLRVRRKRLPFVSASICTITRAMISAIAIVFLHRNHLAGICNKITQILNFFSAKKPKRSSMTSGNL